MKLWQNNKLKFIITYTLYVPLMVVIALSHCALAMNDTDAVVDDGIFPTDVGSKVLRLLHEQHIETVKEGGCKQKRIYVIENTGKADAYNFILNIAQNAYTSNVLPEITAEGSKVKFDRKIGRLSDRGNHVAIKYLPKEAIDKCNENNDGDICDHSWYEFVIHFPANGKKTVAFELDVKKSLNYCSSFALYGEKFWSSNEIPAIDFIVDTSALKLPESSFESVVKSDVLDPYPDIDIRADSVKLHYSNYKPTKQSYTYITRVPTIDLTIAFWEHVKVKYGKHPRGYILSSDDPTARKLLLVALTDSNAFIRGFAASVLGKTKTMEAVPRITPLLGDSSLYVREIAAKSLVEITGENYGEDQTKWQLWWKKTHKPVWQFW